MAEDKTEENSADFAQGISLDQLPDGGKLVGHFNGEDVLLVRSGDEIFAVSPHCTHYNGPLVEGLMVGDTVHRVLIRSHAGTLSSVVERSQYAASVNAQNRSPEAKHLASPIR
jgi:nitrite reductase/ring-hydroxylating ferredoxin subunit